MAVDDSSYFHDDQSSIVGELIVRSAGGDLAALERQLASKPNIDALDEDGMALIHYAACQGNVQLIQALWRSGADLNLPDDGSPPWKPIQYAIFHRHHEAEQSLVELGAKAPLPIVKRVMLQQPPSFQPGKIPAIAPGGAFATKS